jgi:hypothetical protein
MRGVLCLIATMPDRSPNEIDTSAEAPGSRVSIGVAIAVVLAFSAVLVARHRANANADANLVGLQSVGAGSAASATSATNASDAGTAGADAGAAGRAALSDLPQRSGLGCQPIRIEAVENQGDRIHWWDAACHERTVLLIPNEHPDSAGLGGGYAREFTFDRTDLGTNGHRRVGGTDTYGWRGFGYVVAHFSRPHSDAYDDVETLHPQDVGVHAVAMVGAHHLLYRFHWRLTPGAPIDVTVDWLFATGRDHPLYSITYDSRPAGPNVVRADARAPYGDVHFEGDDDFPRDIAGVQWGDKYRFITTHPGDTRSLPQPPMTRDSAWDYREPNIVPFDRLWSAVTDAEMGLVGTARWDDKPQGGDYGDGLIQKLWGTTGKGMPIDWAWPFQINQYDLPYTTASHRLAWGMTFGSVGEPVYGAFGRELSGYPYQSYAVHIVLGGHLDSAVLRQMDATEVELATEMSATRGRLSTEAPGGPSRVDTVQLTPPGWDSAYSVWSFETDLHPSAITAHIRIPSGRSLASPMFRISGWTTSTVHRIRVGRELIANTEMMTTFDAPNKALWVTIPRVLKGDLDIAID